MNLCIVELNNHNIESTLLYKHELSIIINTMDMLECKIVHINLLDVIFGLLDILRSFCCGRIEMMVVLGLL